MAGGRHWLDLVEWEEPYLVLLGRRGLARVRFALVVLVQLLGRVDVCMRWSEGEMKICPIA